MPCGTVVSWKTFALFVLFLPLAVVAIILFPLTLLVLFWLYYRGEHNSLQDASAQF